MTNWKNIYCFIFLLIGIILSPKNISAQNENSELIRSALPQYHSPQVASLLRFDETPIDLYVGRADITIPLINFSDPDFNLPINIKYNTGGFKPSESDNFVGNNWALMPTFAIYREVKGIPDEVQDLLLHRVTTNNVTETFNGFLNVRNLNIDAEKYKENLWTNPSVYAPLGHYGFARINEGGHESLLDCEHADYNVLVPKGHRKGTEVSSDIYRFSCGKHSGYFTIDFDGKPQARTTSGGKVEVDISKYKTINPISLNTSGENTSEITIRTDDGYTYVFGGNYAAMEYMAMQWADYENPSENYASMHFKEKAITTPIVNAYFLSKIIAPNGRILTIEYDDRVTPDYHKDPTKTINLGADHPIKKAYQLQAALINHQSRPAPINHGNPVVFDENHFDTKKSFSLNKIAIMKSITIENKKIVFDYKNKEENILEIFQPSYSNYYNFNTTPIQLKYVTYTSGTNEIDKAELEYSDNGRLFLKSIKNNLGKYEFEYKSEEAISPLTPNFDHWGYTTGNIQNSALIPRYTMDPLTWGTQNWIKIEEDGKRGPAKEDWDKNMLNRILYPTGGRTELIYEQHTYSKDFERTVVNNYRPSLNLHSENIQAGGVRISKVKYFDNDQLQKTKHFLYQKSISDSISSGILFYKPTYVGVFTWHSDKEDVPVFLKSYNSTLGFNPQNKDRSHIGYSSVIECDISTSRGNDVKENGYKQIIFTERVLGAAAPTYDKTYLFNYRYNITRGAQDFTIDDGFMENCFRDEFDSSQESGLIKKEIFYNNLGHPVKSIEYEYSRFPSSIYDSPYTLYVNQPKTEYMLFSHLYAQLNKIYTYQYRNVRKIIKDYTNITNVETKEEYGYTNDGIYMTSQKTIDSHKNIHEKKYTYGFKDDNAPYIPSSITKESVINNNKHNYIKNYYYDIKENLASSKDFPLNRQQVLSEIVVEYGKNENPELDTATEIKYMNHDKYGNPVCVIDKNNTPTVYLWSYYGQYPIAKIEGVTYNQIKRAQIDANILAGRSNPDQLEYDAIRNLSNMFPDILITTYKYAPSIGMTLMIDPSGKCTHYEYDELNRLKLIKDHDGNIIESYEYNYRNK